MDVTALTETSEKEDTGFQSNVDTIERLDLNINSLEYENMWIEIKNKMSNNIIAIIYRHPNFTMS